MKKLLMLAAMVALVLGIAVPALAGAGIKLSVAPRTTTDGKATTFELNGKVVRVFTTAGALKVNVRVGSAGVRPFIGRDLSMRVGFHAVLLSTDEGIAHAIKLGQIKAGQTVHVEGRIDRTIAAAPVYVATSIQVRHWTPTAQLTEFACGGPVTAIDAAGLHLTVNSASRVLWTAIGTNVTVALPDGVRLFKWVDGVKVPIALADLAIGDRVWTRGTIDRSQAAPVFSADVVVLRQVVTQP
jgi:hypothetical protein